MHINHDQADDNIELLTYDRSTEEKHVQTTPLINTSVSPKSSCMSILFSGFCSFLAFIAVIAVPYYVAKSIFYLATDNSDASFHDIMTTDNIIFWLFGPLMALLATMAIAPFNIYNTYKVTKSANFSTKQITIRNVSKLFIGTLFLSSGSVNGYNFNFAYKDIFGNPESAFSLFMRGFIVFIATVFAGLSEGRVVLSALMNELPRDFRYTKRLVNSCYSCFFYQREPLPNKITLLNKLQHQLDDYRNICLLKLNEIEVDSHTDLLNNNDWINDIKDERFIDFISIVQHQFPLARFIVGDILGTIVSSILAYYGNKNSINYAYKACFDFFVYLGADAKSSSLNDFSNLFSYFAYCIGFLLSLFLIRDLFFRDICKAITLPYCRQHIIKATVPLLPALSFGTLNIFLTVMNQNLSAFDKFITAISAIIGATVISRYGIAGGMEEFMGRHNKRRDLANISDILMRHFRTLDEDTLIQITQQIDTVVNQTADSDDSLSP